MGLVRSALTAVRAGAGAANATAEAAPSGEGLSPLHGFPDSLLVGLAFLCLILAACASGMTLGYMSLDTIGLEIISNGSNRAQADAASAILPIRAQGNFLLVSLLLTNTIATELLPLVLEALVPGGYFSLVTSVLSLILFGEIIPQAICSRHALQIGAKMIGFVKFLRIITYPVAAPIAWLLDVMLGEELGTVYDRDGLKGLIDLHARSKYGSLTEDETVIMKGTLDFSQKTVMDVLTKAENVFMLDVETKLSKDVVMEMLRRGHSRIPLFEGKRNNIVCLLLLKQLVLVDVDDEVPIRALINKKKRAHKIRVAPALHCTPNASLSEVLSWFLRGRSHMAIIYDKLDIPEVEREFMGIVTLEDIIEEIVSREIVDETDEYVSNERTQPVYARGVDGKLQHALQVRPGATTTLLLKEIDVKALRGPLSAVLRGELPQRGHDRLVAGGRSKPHMSDEELALLRMPALSNDFEGDGDDIPERDAERLSEELSKLRRRQFSLPVTTSSGLAIMRGDGSADEEPVASSPSNLKWKDWTASVEESEPSPANSAPAVSETGSGSSIADRKRDAPQATGGFRRTTGPGAPTTYMSLDMAAFPHLADSEDEMDPGTSTSQVLPNEEPPVTE